MGSKIIWEQLARLLLFGLRPSLSSHIFFSRFHFLIFIIIFTCFNFFLFNDKDWDFLFFNSQLNHWTVLLTSIAIPLISIRCYCWSDQSVFLSNFLLSFYCFGLITNDVSTMMLASWRCSLNLIYNFSNK